MADLIHDLLSRGREFNFFQAVSLLEEQFAETRGGGDKVRDPIESGRIRFEPDPSITFPPNDITRVTDKKGAIHFLLTFMGLVGVSSPLPIYFSEYLSRYPENAKALLDFLSIFNHRTYALFYRAWKKYHFIRNFTASGNDPFTRQIAFLSGVTSGETLSPDRIRMLAYAGAMAGSSRGKAGLESIVSDTFDGITVCVEEFVPRWAPLRDIRPLGNDSRLGVNAMVGSSVYDISGKFRVAIGPLRRETYQTFLDGTENIALLRKIIDSFITDPLDYDIEVKLQSIDLIPVILGKDNTRLGETSALGQSSGRTDIHSVII